MEVEIFFAYLFLFFNLFPVIFFLVVTAELPMGQKRRLYVPTAEPPMRRLRQQQHVQIAIDFQGKHNPLRKNPESHKSLIPLSAPSVNVSIPKELFTVMTAMLKSEQLTQQSLPLQNVLDFAPSVVQN